MMALGTECPWGGWVQVVLDGLHGENLTFGIWTEENIFFAIFRLVNLAFLKKSTVRKKPILFVQNHRKMVVYLPGIGILKLRILQKKPEPIMRYILAVGLFMRMYFQLN